MFDSIYCHPMSAAVKVMCIQLAITVLEAGPTLPLDVMKRGHWSLRNFLLSAVIEINKFVQKIGSSDSSSFWRSFQPDCLRKGLSVLDPKTGQEETEFRFKLVITSARAFYVQMTTIELELICGTDASKILGLLTWFECIHHARSLLTSHQILKCFIEWGFNYINCPQICLIKEPKEEEMPYVEEKIEANLIEALADATAQSWTY